MTVAPKGVAMVEVQLAGRVAIAGSASALGRRVDRRVLIALALADGPLSKPALAELVWDGSPPTTWDTALRGATSRLRRALAEAGAPEAIRSDAGAQELTTEVAIDVARACASVAAAEEAWRRGDLVGCLSAASAAAEVLGGEVAPGEEGPWFDAERHRCATIGRRALALLADAAASLGRWSEALDASDAIVATDPLDEPAYRRMIAAHAALGNRAGALRAYERCRAVLAEELGASPSEATETAYLTALGAFDGPLDLDPTALVRHLLESPRPDDVRRAALPAIGAAEVLEARGAHDAAVALLVEVRDRLEAVAGHAASERARVHAALMVARAMSNDVDAARAELRAAAQLALAAGDPGALTGVAGALRSPPSPQVDEEMLSLAERLLALAPPGTRSRVTLLMWLSHELARSDAIDRSAELAEEAIEQARSLGGSDQLRAALQTWHVNAYAFHTPPHRAAAMEEALGVAGEEPLRLLDGLSRAYLAADLVDSGRPDEALAHVRRLQREAGGPPMLRWLGARIEAMLATIQGRWDEAEELVARSEAIAAELGTVEAPLITFTLRTALAFHRGGLEPFRDLAVAFASAPGALPLIVASAAQLSAEVAASRPTSAGPPSTPEVDALVRAALDVQAGMPRWLTFWATTVETAEAAARSAAATDAERDRLEATLAEQAGTIPSIPGASCLGPVDRVRALLLAGRDPRAASRLLSSAARQCKALGSGPFLARTLVDHAELLERHGRPSGAPDPGRLAAEAAVLVDRHGLVPLQARLCAL